MKKYLLACLLSITAGCNAAEPPPLTPEQYKEQYEARQAVITAEANAKAKLAENKVMIPKSPTVEYEVELTIVCLRGIQYYYQRSGWSVWLAPVAIKNYSYPFAECKQ